jgi:hypothetical protein
LGHKPPRSDHAVMSALTSKADIDSDRQNVRFGSKADNALQQERGLFDHFVGAREQRSRDGETQRPRGLEVDDKFELGRLLHRKIGRLGAI